MIAAPSPSPAPAWVNDHRHAGHKRTYFARFPEKRASLWGCSLCAGSALPTGSCEQPLLPAGDGLLLAGLHQPGRLPGLSRCPCCAAAAPRCARARGCSFTCRRPRKGSKADVIAQSSLRGCYVPTTAFEVQENQTGASIGSRRPCRPRE